MNVLVILRGNRVESEEDQLQRCKQYAQSKEWHLKSITMKDSDEQSLPSLENNLQNIDVVLATDLSQVALSLQVFNRILNILEKHNVRLFTVKDGEVVDFSC